MRSLVVLLAVAMLVPGPAAADPLERLLHEDLLPETRAALVAEACEQPVTPSDLRELFESNRRTPQLDATQIAVCREDPELLPLMFEEFGRSSLGVGRGTDPDVFERLLRGMQGFPVETLRDRLVNADRSVFVDALHERIVDNWLTAVSPDPNQPLLSELPLDLRTRIEDRVDAFIEQLLALGEEGVVLLQVDSGDAVAVLMDTIRFEYAAHLVAHGTPEEVEAGEQLRRQLPGSPEVSLEGNGRRYPVRPLDVQVPAGGWFIPARPRPLSTGMRAALFAFALLGLAVLLVRLRPGSRGLVFRLGAVLLPVVGLLLLEGLLGLADVAPLADLRPALDPNQVANPRYETRALEGTPHIVSVPGGHRYEAFRVPKPPGMQRVIVLGESSVHGTHYLREEAFVSRMDALLGAEVEVLNAGIGGALSDEITRMGIHMLDWDPDLLVLDFGYNDLTHIPYAERYRGVDLPRMATRAELSRWRVVRVLHDLLPDALYSLGPQVEPAYLDDRDASAAPLTDLTAFARRNVVTNIRRLASAARAAGVPVLIVSQPTEETACVGAERLDEQVEQGCYRDELAAIAEEASRITGQPLFDGAGLMRAAAVSHGPVEQAESWHPLFWDGVHPTRLGHAVLGEALAPVVAELLDD